MVEYLHDRSCCRTLFATHYHELTELARSLPAVRNLNVAVREWDDHIVFLHKIVEGAADKSYGIHVAQLAGVPPEVNARATEILSQLESHSGKRKAESGSSAGESSLRLDAPSRTPSSPNGHYLQMTLFETANHPLLDTIRGVDLNTKTPLEIQQLVQQWQTQLAGEGTVAQSKPR